jgi:hypothetical protein
MKNPGAFAPGFFAVVGFERFGLRKIWASKDLLFV